MPVTDVLVVGTRFSQSTSLADALRRFASPLVRIVDVPDPWALETRLAQAPRADAVRVIACTTDPLESVRRARACEPAPLEVCAHVWQGEHAALVRTAVGCGRPVLFVHLGGDADERRRAAERVTAFVGLPDEARPRLAEPEPPPGGALSVREVREVARALHGSELLGLMGFALRLPAWDPHEPPARRAETRAWVAEEMLHVRESIAGNRVGEAVEALHALLEHFGPGLDTLDTGLSYETVALLLVDILHAVRCHAAALPVVQRLLEHRPASEEARIRLAATLRATARESAALAA